MLSSEQAHRLHQARNVIQSFFRSLSFPMFWGLEAVPSKQVIRIPRSVQAETITNLAMPYDNFILITQNPQRSPMLRCAAPSWRRSAWRVPRRRRVRGAGCSEFSSDVGPYWDSGFLQVDFGRFRRVHVFFGEGGEGFQGLQPWLILLLVTAEKSAMSQSFAVSGWHLVSFS